MSFEDIATFLTQLGIGSIIGVIVGMFFQYHISKKLKVYETKLILYRRVYKQLYYILLMNHEEIQLLDSGAIPIERVVGIWALDLKRDLGDILYYADGELENLIASLAYTIENEKSPIGKEDFKKMEMILKKLKKFT